MLDDYTELKQAVEVAGFFTDFQPIDIPGDRMVCASHEYTDGPRKGGLGGNSLWVAKRGQRWFVASWSPVIYRIDNPARLTELCLHLLSHKDERAYGDFEDPVRWEFSLVAVSDEEFDNPAAE